MDHLTALPAKSSFSSDDIEGQLQKIFRHPNFIESSILKKFLAFIVQETLSGNSACLKEYTIALKVLEKPVSFNPQQNCIVRIHAGRLRKALDLYYTGTGADDPIVIEIPKGKYVPEFRDRPGIPKPKMEVKNYSHDHHLVIAVLPFICDMADEHQRSFADNVCLQLSSALMQIEELSVIAYPAVKSLAHRYPDLRELEASIGFNYILTGGMQCSKDKVRVNLQLIEGNSYKQLWSETYECKTDRNRTFTTQDDITSMVVGRVKEYVWSMYLPVKMVANGI